MPNLAILGAGGIGATFGAYMARAGLAPVLIDPWFHHVEAIRENGLTLLSPEDEFNVPIRILHIDEFPEIRQPINHLFIALKSYDTEWALRLAQPYLAPTATIVSLQNGVNEETLIRLGERRRTVGCVVALSAELVQPGVVRRTSGPEWPAGVLGELDGQERVRTKNLSRLLSSVGKTTITDNIWGELWAKLTLNTFNNSLSGATGFTTRELWSNPRAIEVEIHVAGECAEVAEKLGIDMESVLFDISPKELVSAHRGNASAWNSVSAKLNRAADKRRGKRENRSSLLQDLFRKRRTEIDYLNGYVCGKGLKAGVKTDWTAAVWRLVRQVERGSLIPEPANLDLLDLSAASLSGDDRGQHQTRRRSNSREAQPRG